MNSVQPPELQSQLDSFERRLHRAERWSLINRVGWTIVTVVVLLLFWTNNHGVAQAQSQKLRLRELDIVDEKGRERIVIAAPLPVSCSERQSGTPYKSRLRGSSI
jgi:hypothetical protein